MNGESEGFCSTGLGLHGSSVASSRSLYLSESWTLCLGSRVDKLLAVTGYTETLGRCALRVGCCFVGDPHKGSWLWGVGWSRVKAGLSLDVSAIWLMF